MNIYRFDSDTEYKLDSFDCGDSDLNDKKNAVIFTLAYFENKRIIQKRPAHLSIVERLGGFSHCKDTNNY